MLKLGWLSTGRGEGSRGFLQFIYERIATGVLDAKIEFVFCNREPGEAEGSDRFLRMVEEYGLPMIAMSSRRYRRDHGGGQFSDHRGSYHNEAMKAMSVFSPDICVLAGYMLITSLQMVQRYKMINVHPAAPSGPTGAWQDVIWMLIRDEAVESGVTVHVATEMLDAGSVIAYCTFPIRGGAFDSLWRDIAGRTIHEIKAKGEDQPLFQLIRREGIRRERPLLLETLKLLASGNLKVSEGRLVGVDGMAIHSRCINKEIETLFKWNELH